MANVLIDKEKIDILANAISAKSGEALTLTLDEMVDAVDGIETGGITPTGNINITSAGTTDVTNYATATVSSGSVTGPTSDYDATSGGLSNDKGILRVVSYDVPTTPSVSAGYISSVTATSRTVYQSTGIPYNPTITVSGDTVTIPRGFYTPQQTKTVASGTLGAASYSRYKDSTNLNIAVSFPNATAGYYSSITGAVATEWLENVTVTPSESVQVITPTSIRYYLDNVTVNAIPSDYIGSGITRRDSTDLSASGATVSVPSGYYQNNASKAVSSGTEGTPTATKSSVSNHAITVTPSVTNSAGYINGGTHSGTAVTVSASELVSGTYTVSASGTADITNYASLSVPSGSVTPAEVMNGTSATLTTGTNTLTLTKTLASTPQVTAGYISSGTVGNTNISLTASVNTRSSSDLTASNLTVTAPSGYYASNATKTLTDANLLAANIKKDVPIFGVTGTYEGSGGGSDAHYGYVENTPDSANVLSFQLNGLPTSCFVYVKSSLTPTSDVSQVSAIVWDGGDYIGDHYVQTITNTANAQVSYVNGGVYHSISGDSPITITFFAGMGDDIAFANETYVCIYSYGTTSTVDTKTQSVGSGATSITFTGLTKTPQYFGCIFTSNFSTSSGYQRVIAVGEFEGDCYGLEMDSGAHYSNAHWSYSYSNGSLTITSQGTNAGGYFHQPGNYLLVYSYDNNASYQDKTVTPTTSQQVVEADTGYLGLSSVTVNAIPSSYVQPTTTIGATTYRASTSSQTIQSGTYHSAAATIAAVTQSNLTAANIKSGTTISISNGQSNLWSVTGTYTGGGGGSSSVDTKTVTASNRPTTLSFTSMKGEPTTFILRCAATMSRSSNSSYYYVAVMRYNGTNTTGNCWRMSNGQWTNITSGYSWSYSGTTLTLTSSGTTTTSPGCFYPGSYELVYTY